jgi:hypothetical protein
MLQSPIIIINKSNMSTLMHFKDSDKAALYLINGNGFNAKNWIIIKDENKVVDISHLEGISGVYTQHKQIREQRKQIRETIEGTTT